MLGRRVDDDLAGVGIDDQHVAIVDPLHRVGHADHQGQVQAARQDRAMRERTAGGGDDADHALRLQLRQFRRCHVVAHQDLAGHALEIGRALVQKRMDAPDHMVQIVHAAAQVGIFHAVEHRRQAIALHTQRVVGAVAVRADQIV